MTARAYYNEFDPEKAAWLRELIQRGVIAPGDVDERDIRDVRPADLDGYAQCHWFAGIGVWSFALRLAGWPDDQPIWTASCPCQPFSQAGEGNGFADERHLWPALFHLIRVRRPDNLAGEQVASKHGLEWLDLVHSDLEGESYPVGAVDFCSAGIGAPNIRQRLFFMAHPLGGGCKDSGAVCHPPRGAGSLRGSGLERVADAGGKRRHGEPVRLQQGGQDQAGVETAGSGGSGGLDDAERNRWPAGRDHHGEHDRLVPGSTSAACLMGNADGAGLALGSVTETDSRPVRNQGDSASTAGPVNGFWRNAQWVCCEDGRWRPTEPGAFPLVTGAAARVVRLRGYGDAINAQAAAEFIRASLDVMESTHAA